MNGSPSIDLILTELLTELGQYISPPAGNLPKPGVSILSLAQLPLSIGNMLGVERLGSFSVAEVKGLRLEAVVRFRLWGTSSEEVDREAQKLLGRLIEAKDNLRAEGFLKISLHETLHSEEVSSLNAWCKYADYRVLYEYCYHDTDGASSLISRIPININEQFTIISGEMVRWDSQSAAMLSARLGAVRLTAIGALSILAFLPENWDGLGVTLSACFGDTKHEKKFSSLREFCSAFDLEKENGEVRTVELGGKPYNVGRLAFPNTDFPDPMTFKSGNEYFCVSYSAPPFDSDAVVYLRLLDNG